MAATRPAAVTAHSAGASLHTARWRWPGRTSATHAVRSASLRWTLPVLAVFARVHTLDDFGILTVELLDLLSLLLCQVEMAVHIVVEAVDCEVFPHGWSAHRLSVTSLLRLLLFALRHGQ